MYILWKPKWSVWTLHRYFSLTAPFLPLWITTGKVILWGKFLSHISTALFSTDSLRCETFSSLHFEINPRTFWLITQNCCFSGWYEPRGIYVVYHNILTLSNPQLRRQGREVDSGPHQAKSHHLGWYPQSFECDPGMAVYPTGKWVSCSLLHSQYFYLWKKLQSH